VAILLLQVPVVAVSIDEARSPDRDHTQILEHLVRYCSKFDPLPAITIAIEGRTSRVLRGHKYVLAARALGKPIIRAVVTGTPTSGEVASFVASTGAKILDWEAIKAAEERETVTKAWHIFFFERSLSSEEKAAFDTVVASLFSDGAVRVTYDDEGPLAEFEAMTPVADAAWAARHLDAFAGYSRERVPIVSYQGRRFGSLGAGAQTP